VFWASGIWGVLGFSGGKRLFFARSAWHYLFIFTYFYFYNPVIHSFCLIME
jgi:hypothetical protein